MKKTVLGVLMGIMLATGAQAIDVRLLSGVMVADNIFIEDATMFGIGIAEYTNKRKNGLSYGFNAGLMTAEFDKDNGTHVNLNLDIVYRMGKRYEPYITGGGTYQNLNNSDYGFGYNYGGGLRYSSCKGFQVGLEFIKHQLEYSASRMATAKYNGAKYTNHNISFYLGYRF